LNLFLEVRVSCPEPRQEELIPSLIELGCTGFYQTDSDLIGYVPVGESQEVAAGIAAGIRTALLSISSNFEIATRTIEDRNWNEEWERSVLPVEVGDRFVITPSWRLPLEAGRRTMIVIDPKMSFGTGYHETTRLMLRFIERFVPPAASVLDVGTGTGVLAIAAALSGARFVVATDIDEWSIANATENTGLNGVEAVVSVVRGSVPGTLPPGPVRGYDLVCANITLNDIISLMPALRSATAAGGALILSGFFLRDAVALQAHLESAGMTVTGSISENEWLALSAAHE
jgi:ribosomal protein L11 methyltransferase